MRYIITSNDENKTKGSKGAFNTLIYKLIIQPVYRNTKTGYHKKIANYYVTTRTKQKLNINPRRT